MQWQAGARHRRRPDALRRHQLQHHAAGTNILGTAANPAHPRARASTSASSGARVKIPGTDIEIANLRLLARALEADTSANMLSTPNVLTLDNEEAKIVVGQNVPFITGSYTPTSGSATNPFQTIERHDIGLTLRVTPQVSEGGAVKLQIFQEVSSVTRDKALVQSADIITNKRSLESTVLVDDGQIVVLGGLIQDDQQAGDRQGAGAGRHPLHRRALPVRDAQPQAHQPDGVPAPRGR